MTKYESNMNLKQAIQEYRKLAFTQATAGVLGGTSAVKQQKEALFHQIDDNMSTLIDETTDDVLTATLLFSEMSIREIGELTPFVAYYYCTLAYGSIAIKPGNRVDAQRLRLFALFQHLNDFNRLIELAHTAPMMRYQGNLSFDEFVDFLIMSDAYIVWDTDMESDMLKSIQRLVAQHEALHPSFSKAQIINEGQKAHQALFTAVKYALNK